MSPITTEPVTVPDVHDLATGRAALDALDAGIRELVAQRMTVSKQVQVIRRGAGQPGIQHARENQVIDGYVRAFGDQGADIALAVLQLCRGRHG